MIYSVKAEKADYEQIWEVIVVADNKKEAVELAEKEFNLAKDWYYPWVEQILTAREINLSKKGSIAVIRL